MKWGTLYGPEYVNRLYAMARLRTSDEIRFICLTDDPSGIRGEIETRDCPSIDVPSPYNTAAWRKLSLFDGMNVLSDLTGNWLYLDLDVVVTDSLDPFFTHEPDSPFIVMRNWSQPKKLIGNTSVYRFEIGQNSHLLHDFLKDHDRIIKTYRNSQTYISANVRELKLWPDSWCTLFKVHCLPPWPARFWRTPTLPRGSRVVAFPGKPNPHDAEAGQWPETSFAKKIYKFVKPTPWVNEHWTRAEDKIQ